MYRELRKFESTRFDISKKAEDEIAKFRIYCKCGHSMLFFPFEKEKKKLCSYCGHYVYYNKKEEFLEKLKGEIKRC